MELQKLLIPFQFPRGLTPVRRRVTRDDQRGPFNSLED